MATADNPATGAGQSLPASVDLVIIGAGVMGLWAAVKADRLGIPALLVDAGLPGGGASGGLLGALMPYMPDRWDGKKQFQLDALVSLEAEITRVEDETGLSCGYRRCGRVIPLPKPHLREIALRHREDAASHWHVAGRRFGWEVIDEPPQEGWVDDVFTGAGLVHDTLSARISPRLLIAALVRRLQMSPTTRIVGNRPAGRIDPQAGRLHFDNGDAVAFGHCIVAAGQRSFALLEALDPRLTVPLGRPVKGQAALLEVPGIDPSSPVIFLNGLYVVPHDDGRVAIGSTSEEEFTDASTTDEKLEDVLARARALVPALRDAAVVERWAGLRPKAIGRDPMVGPHPDRTPIVALTGGFKVSFGLAHRLADAALAAVTGDGMGNSMDLPASFTLEEHLRQARAKNLPEGV